MLSHCQPVALCAEGPHVQRRCTVWDKHALCLNIPERRWLGCWLSVARLGVLSTLVPSAPSFVAESLAGDPAILHAAAVTSVVTSAWQVVTSA